MLEKINEEYKAQRDQKSDSKTKKKPIARSDKQLTRNVERLGEWVTDKFEDPDDI